MRISCLAAVVSLALVEVLPAQTCTPIQDRVSLRPDSRAGTPFEISRVYELLNISLDEVIAAADMVVEGRVRPVRSYLSENGCVVLTDYEVSIVQVHRGAVTAPDRPGVPRTVTFTMLGGDIVVRGVQVVFGLEDMTRFEPDQAVMLALSGKPGALQLAKEPYGAFTVENGRVVGIFRSRGRPVLPDTDRTTFLARVHDRR